MIKLVYCLKKKPEVSQKEFNRYWREKHGPLVTSLTRQINATKYVQSHTIDTPINQNLIDSRGLAAPYDGITEVWWNSEQELNDAMNTEEGQKAFQALLEDESGFIDFSQSRVFITKENLIFDTDLNIPYNGAPA
jgi:uncharacterized protein (TIGR02118 family)